MTAYWYCACPKCDDQGRLVIRKRHDNRKLIFHCDECEAAWNSREEIGDRQKTFLGLDVPSSYATLEEIKANGWEKFARHPYAK